jgi:hypothetical protein
MDNFGHNQHSPNRRFGQTQRHSTECSWQHFARLCVQRVRAMVHDGCLDDVRSSLLCHSVPQRHLQNPGSGQSTALLRLPTDICAQKCSSTVRSHVRADQLFRQFPALLLGLDEIPKPVTQPGFGSQGKAGNFRLYHHSNKPHFDTRRFRHGVQLPWYAQEIPRMS